ncbi:squalene/phytoene synthase family protein [Ketogulonicigenium vulgare]|uniref:squalene/phytoene synthase family protein n=1 Tax=Ketogulonicigenium vulgare TaxID=92945 RepID=UPI00235934EC|nr:squalene/phytoene synthase family protein [Ketogulonicigenium vulgare]
MVNVALAELVREGDADRFAATMAAPVPARAPLFALAALNLELARIGWISDNPLIVAMRLQWWHDIVDGRAAPSGDVALALAGLLERGLDPDLLHPMIAARGEQSDLMRFLRDTAGNLSALAGRATGARDINALQDIGLATGIANWLLAGPALLAKGKTWLPASVSVGELAGQGLALLDRRRGLPKSDFPAALWSVHAGPVLRRAKTHEADAMAGGLAPSEAARRLSLLWRAMRGRW